MNGFSLALFLSLSLAFSLAFAGLLAADEPQLPDVPLVTPAIRHLVQRGDYAAAIAAIDDAFDAESPDADRLLYLKGRALHWDGQFEAAAAVFTTLVDQYPDSQWRRRAQFDAGLALVSKGDFHRADLLYRSAATALLAVDRKHELAEICLEFADTYFGPVSDDREPKYRQPQQGYYYEPESDDEGPEPDYERAQQFYERALEIGVKAARRADVELRVARCLQETDLRHAVYAYRRYIEEHADNPLVVEARYRLGQCHSAADEPKQARWAWQDLLAVHVNDPSERVAEAAFDLSRTWGIPQPSSDAEMELGIASLESFLQRYPTHRLASLAHLDIARSWMNRDRYKDAARRLEQLLGDERYHESGERAQARNLLGQAYREQDQFAKALTAWRQYLTDYPTDSDWSEVQQQVVDTEYMMGLDRFQANDYDAARRVLAQFMGKYPLDERVPGIFVLLGRMDYQEKKFDAAIAAWRRVVSKYPDTDESAYSQTMIGTVLEQELDDPQAALEAYKKVGWGGRNATARLTDKTMAIATERVFRSDEAPRVKLTTRNLESVSVRVYRIDIPSYFRKVHAIDRIEQLDIALIDPTTAFEYQIADYAPHQELERYIEIPLPDGATRGAVAVTVASETHEATTLVLQSDLDLIIKTTVDDVFVFAQNMVTGKPWPDAQLLISDGQQIIAQGVTGDDGVYHTKGDVDIETGDPSVLAMADGHVNSIEAFLAPTAEEEFLKFLIDRGYVFTDRPVYCAGQSVHIRGCIRRITGDDREIESGRKFTLQVIDPRDRIIREEEIALNEFGSFQAEFLLPPITPAGEYQIGVSDGKKHRHQGSFQVREVQPGPLQLTIELPRRVYYRGETIEGAILAANDDGSPLPNRAVVYQLADGRRYSAKTDEDGRIAVKLETRDCASSKTLPLVVALADQNVQTTANVFLASQGFSIDLHTVRDAFLAGEALEVAVATTDAAGEPVNRNLLLKVLKLTALNGRVTEQLVDEQAFETSADAGVANPRIQLDEGGSYRLRVEGLDRFGNPVSAEKVVGVSDETDNIRLRVLADQHHLRAGDTAEVTLHWRGAPALALVTFETTGVLDYQLLPLKTGVNTLSVQMNPRYAPNFKLVANVMTDPRTLPDWQNRGEGTTTIRFHEASSPFIVRRELELDVTWRLRGAVDRPLRPGDRVQVTVQTGDSQGNPVPAEVSLAMIDQTILSQFPCPVPKIQEFFRPTIQDSSVCSDSSIEFCYYPTTIPINARLLTEKQQQELARREQASLQDGLGNAFAGMGGGMYGGYGGEDSTRNWGEYGSDFLSLIEAIDRESGDTDFRVMSPSDNPAISVSMLLAPRDEPTADDAQTTSESNLVESSTEWTAYWNPSIVTGHDGRATVELRIPEIACTWTLVARGVTQGVLVGEVSTDMAVRSEDVVGDLQDVAKPSAPVRPDGLTVYARTGGVAEADTTCSIESNPLASDDTSELQIVVAPTVQRSLLDVLAGDQISNHRDVQSIEMSTGRNANDLMAALGLKGLIASEPEPIDAASVNLDQVIRNGIGHLVSSQNGDGGWGWSSPGTVSDRQTSARVLWALALARRAGYPVPDQCFDIALKYVDGQIAATENRDFENKAILAHALSTAGKGEFFLANRLYRERESLSPSALLHLALSFAEMNRKETARELLAGVTVEQLDDAAHVAASPVSRPARTHRPEVLRALYLLAVQAVMPDVASTDDVAMWLLANRSGHRWSPDEATGPATLALCHWAHRNRLAADRYRLAIRVNDVVVTTLELDYLATTQVVDVPRRHLVEGRQKIDFQLQGEGRYVYQVVLGGSVAPDQVVDTTKDWFLRRMYDPAPLEVDGREVPRGFDIVQGTAGRFRNRLTQLPVGERGLVELRYWRAIAVGEPSLAVPEEYLVITEPIPSGTQVIPNSVRGAFDHYEIARGSITFFLGRSWKPGVVGYELRGRLPGQYRVPPAKAWNAYRPSQMAASTVGDLTVLPSGAKSTDAYRLTPDELFRLGELAIERDEMAEADRHLAQLLDEWSLTPATYREVVSMLLKIQLSLGKSAEVIRYFEVIQERWPDERIALDDGMKIAAAYHELGEFERSYLGFRAVVESNFKQESGTAGFLESQDLFLAAVGVMERLLSEYPPEPYAATAQYALAQQVFARSSSVEEGLELADAGVNRVDVVTHAWRLLEDFLTNHADDPATDQVAFSAANALLDLEQFTEAAAACERYTRRYPNSKLLDGLWYIIGYCQFADGQHESAVQALQRVVDLSSAVGEREENSNRWAALYILGQIYHSLGKPAEAIEYYRQVEEHFPDARKSIDYFLRKTIRFDEVTTVRPGEPVAVELTYRNITACDVRVYRIDLMKFALLHQNLGSIAMVNLAGIEPQQAKTVALGDGLDYRDRTHAIALDIENEGAYLIVCRGDDHYASGLLLISPLEIEVQYEWPDEEARVVVRDVVADGYVKDAEVRVLGGFSADLVSGQTDRRGVFVADGIAENPTVIAQAGRGRFAFRCGKPRRATLPTELAQQLRMPRATAGAIAGAAGGGRSPSAGVPLSGGADRVAERRIGAALDIPTAVSFEDAALEDVAKLLSVRHGIPILLDARALDDVGIGTDVPVTFETRGISLRAALRLILKELDLTYVIRDECLLITTPEEAESELVTMIYPVKDLVRFQDTDGQGWADFDTLIETISSTVAPYTWDTVGGPGAIEGMSYQKTDVLILSQTQDVHEQIEGMLTQLRSVAGGNDGDGELPVREKPSWDEGGFQGMGGMGGGMGGMGMGGGASPMTKRAPGQRNELLRGLHNAQRDLQGREIKKLRKMYDQGGMGGGVGAGGFF